MKCLSSGLTVCIILIITALLLSSARANGQTATTRPTDRMRLGVAGLVHGHIYGFLYNVCDRGDVDLVGIAEPELHLRRRYGERHKLDKSVLYADLEKMLDETRPEAVAVFTNTFDHLKVVEACARRGVHVMVEKPLAVSAKHAHAMQRAARQAGIHVLVNYEMTWFPNRQAAFDAVRRQHKLGPIRKIVSYYGHRGPKEIGMPHEFLSWLTNPVQNGSGALHDFGCYGAVYITWLMDGQRPLSVTAVTQKLKSDPVYERVDDEATIVLTYPNAQGVIQASWNWPYDRKDVEIYGEKGYCITVDRDRCRVRFDKGNETQVDADRLASPMDDPVSYLKAVVKGEITPAGPSSLKVNVVVAEILDAARQSAQKGQTVRLER